MIAYIDESGDLGWTLDKPYHQGGSSRFLTISCLLTPNVDAKYHKRIIRDLYTKFRIPTNIEIKGNRLTLDQKKYFVEKTLKLLETHPQTRILSISVQKCNVASHIRSDGNKLYNYMIGLLLLEEICAEEKVILIPDPRAIKVKSGNSLVDYLQTKLWFEFNSTTALNLMTVYSEDSLSLKFIDIISNIVWRKYEWNDCQFADLLVGKIKCKRLFFDPKSPV